MAKLTKWSMLERDKGNGIQNDSQSHFFQDFSSKLKQMWKKRPVSFYDIRLIQFLVVTAYVHSSMSHSENVN